PLLERALADLELGRTGRHTLPGGWSLILRTDLVHLTPPRRGEPPAPAEGRARQLLLPFAGSPRDETGSCLPLAVPGSVRLADGRVIRAEALVLPPSAEVPRSGSAVELDARDLTLPLTLRWPRAGDRFHPLGAPGPRSLMRFLRDEGIPRPDRAGIPLILSGS